MNDAADDGRQLAEGVLDREEYVEQSYLFRALAERMSHAEPVQEVLVHLREEILATTKLPMAVDYLLAELNHVGTMSSAMKKLAHYFTAFQSYLVSEAENEHGRFDMKTAFSVLEQEAKFRSRSLDPTSTFFYQFETLCRNRLSYDYGLAAMSNDPVYDQDWRRWILKVRHQIGIIELADFVYVHSEHYKTRQQKSGVREIEIPDPVLFGEKEGRIALANRKKEPLYFFAALQRHLAYPAVPRPVKRDPVDELLPRIVRTLERVESRLKLLEDEQRDKGIDLSQFFEKPDFRDLPQD